MPIENREILFSSAELTSAITEFHRRQYLNENQNIMKVSVTEDEAAPVNITVLSKETDQPIAESLSKAEVGAALIAYCRRTGVLMSRKSRKSVTIRGGKIALKLRLVSGQSAQDSNLSSLGT
jgi:hypothetical protein